MVALSKKITLVALLIGGLAISSPEIMGSDNKPEKKGFLARAKTRAKGFFSGKKDAPQATNTYVDDAEECPVCFLEWDATTDDEGKPLGFEVKKTVLKPCNHALCELCATDWLKNNDTCPVCTQKVEVSLKNKIRSKFNSLKTTIEKKFSNAKAMIQDKWGRTKERAKNAWQNVKDKAKSTFSRDDAQRLKGQEAE